jgi:threonine aldolase
MTDTSLAERRRLALPAAKAWLPGREIVPPEEFMRALVAETARADSSREWDRYGEAGLVADVESQVAVILGKPAAAMFPSGIMAQQSILRAWTERRGTARIALPGLSHLLVHELDGPQLLNGFVYERLGAGTRPPTAADLAEIPGDLGAVLVELPLRDAGHLLPTWDELAELSEACRARAAPLHVDGARLWESGPYLGHGLAEIADLADSVYVSFYKGLGGLAGAAVAGPEDVVADARRWRTRHGGTLFTLLPLAAAARRGLREELPRMAEYHHRAVEMARHLRSAGFSVSPEPPHTNAFRLYVDKPAEQVEESVVATMEQEGLVLTSPWRSADVPGCAWTEFTVGPATMRWSVEESVTMLARAVLGAKDG